MNITLQDVRNKIIEVDKIEFCEKRQDELIKICYSFQTPTTFLDLNGNISPLLLELRGIIFDQESGEVVARGMHKFFNIDEHQITMYKNFKNGTIIFEEKLDGTLIQAFKYKNKLKFTTNGSLENSLYTDLAAEIVEKDVFLHNFIKDQVIKNNTCLFELTSPKNPIVIAYKDYNLTLLAIRDNESGEYKKIDRDKIGEYIKLPKIYNFANLDAAYNFIQTADGIEGFVLKNIKTGNWAKLKTPWYLKHHKIYGVSCLTIKKVVKMILNNNIDDILGNIDESLESKSLFMLMWDDVIKKKQQYIQDILAEYKIAKKLTRKELGLSNLKHKKYHFAMQNGCIIDDCMEMIDKDICQWYGNKYKGIRSQQYLEYKDVEKPF